MLILKFKSSQWVVLYKNLLQPPITISDAKQEIHHKVFSSEFSEISYNTKWLFLEAVTGGVL